MISIFITTIILIHLRENLSKRIIGGNDITIQKYPFIVDITFPQKSQIHRNSHLCGASIIRKHWIITAAHCVSVFKTTKCKVTPLVIHGNTTYSDNRDPDCVSHTIDFCLIHDLYNESHPFFFDIALIKVKEPFVGLFEKAINLAPKDYVVKPDSAVIALGWGRTIGFRPSIALELKKAKIFIINHRVCRWMFLLHLTYAIISSHTICVGGIVDKQTCYGDSGGPLIQNGLLIGITSFGIGGCPVNYLPSAYMSVSSFSKWIQTNVHEKRKAKRKLH